MLIADGELTRLGNSVDETVSFITYNTKASKPWFVYYAFNHVHTPDFASQDCECCWRSNKFRVQALSISGPSLEEKASHV